MSSSRVPAPTQRAAVARRYHAAEDLERARQRVRENLRYGFPVTKPHEDAIRAAELEYDAATYRWQVIAA